MRSSAASTYRHWAEAAGAVAVQGGADTVVLTPTVADERLRQALRAVELAPARGAVEVGRRLVAVKEQQGELAAAERLAVGLALVAIGDRDGAVAMLRKARDDVDAANAAERPVAVGVGAMINAHLGRLLAEGDDPADLEHAVAYLRDARRGRSG